MGSYTIKTAGIAIKWTTGVWEAGECEQRQYGVYAMGPASDMDTPDGTLLGVYPYALDAADAAHDAATQGMWPDDTSYWVEIRAVGTAARARGWDVVETSIGADECPW
jgi:hypothetical protein